MKALFLLCFSLTAWHTLAQTSVVGSAQVSLVEGSNDCGGSCTTVEIRADISGLSGTGGDAGLNAFVLGFDIDRGDVFASARPGADPVLDWEFFATQRDLVAMTDRLFVVGAVADTSAPNQEYHLATLVLCGSAGNVTLTFVADDSSLGSRLVAGDGPGPIGVAAPTPFTTAINTSFPLDWGTGLNAWLTQTPAYDLVLPMGLVDVADLVKLTNCGEP